MATLTLVDLRHSAELLLVEWSYLNVRDEPLIPMDNVGTKFISFWDNWIIPPNVYGIDPILTLNGTALDPSTDYTFPVIGDSLRTKVSLTTPAGPDAIVLATFVRTPFRNIFWSTNFKQAIRDIMQRLMVDKAIALDVNGDPTVDDMQDPWHIIVKQAGKNALVNLQTMLAGLGRSQLEGVVLDLSRAHNMVHEVIDDLEGDIDRDVVAWRWMRSPVARSVLRSVPGPFNRSIRSGWDYYC